MNLLYPRFDPGLLPAMLGAAVGGAALSGAYGAVHDQVTYALCAEYFTRLKFEQFSYVDFGFSPRVSVAIVGFLATWWVGFVAGWFLARVVLPKKPARPFVILAKGFLIIFVFAWAGGWIGDRLAVGGIYDHQSWENIAHGLGATNVAPFVRVAFIHNTGYLGAAIGLIVALWHCKKLAKFPRC